MRSAESDRESFLARLLEGKPDANIAATLVAARVCSLPGISSLRSSWAQRVAGGQTERNLQNGTDRTPLSPSAVAERNFSEHDFPGRTGDGSEPRSKRWLN